ncbi:hypothetical protein RGU12_08130 [Fredinandcohnia sp. QZ13]|uniref:hypothetical protein n=1 Tax=Fredinandcohnia sp. QZ13 TaxID=3073144 RepID=UPI00285337F0|nr:hypothetical protein [Fredinandcohnia sp. QZ13]MDR4887528.1 hypothetical protein [Fredinandcohnia sp. QZ13]
MKLRELIPNENKLIGLLKFSDKKYLEDLSSGLLYMNQFKFFKEQEEKEGNRGQGDKNELALILNDVDWKLTPIGSDEVVLQGKASESVLRSDDDLQNHLYCATAITPDVLEVMSLNKKTGIAKVKLVLPDEMVEKAENEFGDHVALINVGKFFERVDEAANKKGVYIASNIVRYEDQSINRTERINAFNKGSLDLYFEKDIFFKYQNEYRLVAFGGEPSGPLQLELGDISEDVSIIETKQLLENELIFTVILEELEE